MTTYSLKFINASGHEGKLTVFQKPAPAQDNLIPVAWLTRPATPAGQVTFQWDINYSFAWSEQGALRPDVASTAAQVLPGAPGPDADTDGPGETVPGAKPEGRP